MPLLQIANLSFAYRPVHKGETDTELQGHAPIPILSDINFDVERGELIAIQGPSGSGKSTLLALLAGFLQIQKGTISLNGEVISGLEDQAMSFVRNQKIGYVFQQFHLLPKLTVLENILLPCQYSPNAVHEELRARALELATFLGLENRLHHHPNQLSGGQQQRVAIARALLHNPELILADEPTGNLDSKSADNIIELLLELNRQGKTIIIITHADDIAQKCGRILQIKDGRLVKEANKSPGEQQSPVEDNQPAQLKSISKPSFVSRPAPTTTTEASPGQQELLRSQVPRPSSFFRREIVTEAWRDVLSNKLRSFLTMIGIIVGVASVLAMITLGNFIKEKVLDSYAEMGVNTVLFIGYPNWDMKATDNQGVTFRAFDWESDILPLSEVFPEIDTITPILQGQRVTLSFGGKTIESEGRPVGINEHAFSIAGRKLRLGRGFTPFHIEQKNSVCVIGSEIAEKLFPQISPLQQVLNIQGNQSAFGCQIIGVLQPLYSSKSWSNPNLEVYLPYTLYQTLTENPWDAEITRVLIKLRPGSDIPSIGKSIQGYFTSRYGKTGRFRVHNESVMIAQLQKFLSLFTITLGAIAMVCLLVGGVGITNMMLASIAERFREIGLRKALGATHERIRQQILMESILLCGAAGLIGLFGGFGFCQLVVFVTSKLATNIPYQWRWDFTAFMVSFVSIGAVGILSGLAPAVRAQKLQILEALRSD